MMPVASKVNFSAAALCLFSAVMMACQGSAGVDGQSCSVSSTETGYTITCPNAEPVMINNGASGADGVDGAQGPQGERVRMELMGNRAQQSTMLMVPTPLTAPTLTLSL